jgi:DNA-binding response OmpR family regulator
MKSADVVGGNRKTVLLVKDSEDDVFFMQRAMTEVGPHPLLQVAKDGQEAIDYLSGSGEYADRTRYPIPSLVLLDLKLPKVLGMDVLKWIRSRMEFKIMPVIILTASGQHADWERGYRLGANSFMPKPTSLGDLRALVQCLNDYWFKYNMIPDTR